MSLDQRKKSNRSSTVMQGNHNGADQNHRKTWEEKMSENKRANQLARIVGLSTFLIVFVVLFFVSNGLNEELLNDAQTARAVEAGLPMKPQNTFDWKSDETFELSMKLGKKYLRQNHLKEAQYYYTRALHIKKSNYLAILGMTKVLLKRCNTEGLYCKEAKDYFTVIKQVKNINPKTIEKLQHL